MKPYITLAEAEKRSVIERQNCFYLMNRFLQKDHIDMLTQFIYCAVPEIKWEKFGFRTAGEAWLDDNIVRMNSNFLYSKDADKMIESTVKHEIAHIYAWHLFHEQNHGKNWKIIDVDVLKDDGSIYHNYSAPENKPKNTKIIQCKFCGKIFHVSNYLYKSILDGDRLCNKCGNNLYYSTKLN